MNKFFRSIRKKEMGFFFIALSLVSFASPSYAFLSSYWKGDKSWHPVITLGIGVSSTSDMGESQNFQIQDPVTDQFYNYFSYNPTQTSALFQGFVGAEWKLRPCWLMQLGIDYNQTSPYNAQGTLLQGADVPSADLYNYYYSALTKQVLFEGKLLYTFKARYHPYVLAGLGAAFNKAYGFKTNIPLNLTFTREYSDNTTTSFSYEVGLGVDVDITSNMRFGLGYRFADLGKINLGDATIDTVNVSGTLSQLHLYANQFLAQLTFVFS